MVPHPDSSDMELYGPEYEDKRAGEDVVERLKREGEQYRKQIAEMWTDWDRLNDKLRELEQTNRELLEGRID